MQKASWIIAASIALLLPASVFASTGNLYDVSAIRTADTQYDNTYGSDEFVEVSFSDDGGAGHYEGQVSTTSLENGWEQNYTYYCDETVAQQKCSLGFWVPAGGAYDIATFIDSPHTLTWTEYVVGSTSSSTGSTSGLSTDPVLDALIAAFLMLYTANYVRRLFYS